MDIVERLKDNLKELYELPERGTITEDVSGLRVCSTLTEEEMKAVEKRLGFKLPTLLRRLYLEISNGGFGPSYGLLSFGSGAKNEFARDIVEIYEEFHQDDPTDPFWKWPENFLPVCKLGCGMYLCVDCSTAEGTTFWFEPNAHSKGEAWDTYFVPFASSTEEWLSAWFDGDDTWRDLFTRAALTLMDRMNNSDFG